MNLLTFPGDIGIWMVEFITLSQRWNGLANLFLRLRAWRCSDCSYATLCGCLLLLSNGNWSITVLLNKGPFWSPASCLCTVFPCLRLFCKAARFVTDGTIPFPLHSFCYLWTLSHQPSLPGKKKRDIKRHSIPREVISCFQFQDTVATQTTLIKIFWEHTFFLTWKSSPGGEKDINILPTAERKKQIQLNNQRFVVSQTTYMVSLK